MFYRCKLRKTVKLSNRVLTADDVKELPRTQRKTDFSALLSVKPLHPWRLTPFTLKYGFIVYFKTFEISSAGSLAGLVLIASPSRIALGFGDTVALALVILVGGLQ